MRAPFLAVLALSACRPELLDRPSLVDSTRIIAVRAEPAEVAASESVALAPLVVGPEGTVDDAHIDWALCRKPRPLTDNGSVPRSCLEGSGVARIADDSPAVNATIPADACQRFGPDTPGGEFRPRDPDSTGGYYQPVRMMLDDAGTHETAFAMARMACHVADASVDIAQAFADRYVRNTNPTLVVDDLAGANVGERVRIHASWPAESAERFPVYDVVDQKLVDQREAMTVSWFATAGAFAFDRTGRAAEDDATSTLNTWIAPTEAGVVHMWVVLRDSRGGVATSSLDVDVR